MSSSPSGKTSLFEEIIGLGVGESRVFAPGTFVRMNGVEKPERLGSGMIHMKTRTRLGVMGVSARWLARKMALRELFWMNDELRSDGPQVFEHRIREELHSLTLDR
jgi:hypothetical protein